MMFKKVAFTMYPVQDSARARAFYEGTLGLTVSKTSSSNVWTEYDLPGGGCLALFATQEFLSDEMIKGHAKALGLDLARFTKDLADPELAKRVDASRAEGASIGVEFTPYFLVNGRPYFLSRSVEGFELRFRMELWFGVLYDFRLGYAHGFGDSGGDHVYFIMAGAP